MSINLQRHGAASATGLHSSGRNGYARRWVHAVAWVLVYLFLVAFPLLALLIGPMPKGGGYAWDFAMALGFGGLAIMGLQFVLTARFRRATAPFGTDIIYYFHRWAAIGGVLLLVVHYLVLRVGFAPALEPANPLSAPWPMTAGRVSLVLFVVVIATSLWRKKLGTDYDRWRIWHGVMAVIAVVLAIMHIQGVGHYTRAPWKGAVWIAYSGVWVLVLGYIRVIKPLRLLSHPYRVTDVRQETATAWTVTVAPEKPPRLSFRPGQFAWLTLVSSPFRAKEHPFSFSGSAEDPESLRFTIKELGDFTRTIKDVKPGQVAYVDGPHGVFTTDFHPRAAGFVMVAGGVGVAPMMSMLRTLADRGDRRPVYLIYGNARLEGAMFRDELEVLKGRLTFTLAHVVEEPTPEWQGEVGYVTENVLRRVLPPALKGYVCFLCGPKVMTDSVQASLRGMGVPLRRFHFELFEMV